jgi:hypothetical protein
MNEYRIFYGPEVASQALPWILVVREVGEQGVHSEISRSTHHTAYEAQGERRMTFRHSGRSAHRNR